MMQFSDNVFASEVLRMLKEEFPNMIPPKVFTGGLSFAEEMNVAARCTVDAFVQKNTDEFVRLFDFVEKFIIFGSPQVQDLFITGFLEELKNHSCLLDLDPAVFEEWLGPESHLAWRWLEKKWRGKTSLAGAAKKINTPPR